MTGLPSSVLRGRHCLTSFLYLRTRQVRPRVPEDLYWPEQADRGRGLRARHRHDQLQADGLQEGRRFFPGKGRFLSGSTTKVCTPSSCVVHIIFFKLFFTAKKWLKMVKVFLSYFVKGFAENTVEIHSTFCIILIYQNKNKIRGKNAIVINPISLFRCLSGSYTRLPANAESTQKSRSKIRLM